MVVRKFVIVMFVAIEALSYSQPGQECFGSGEYIFGQSAAREVLKGLNEPLYDDEGNDYPHSMKYVACADYSLDSEVLWYYKQFLEKDHILGINCTFDLGGECYHKGFMFVIDSALVPAGHSANYFNRKLKRARRMAIRN